MSPKSDIAEQNVSFQIVFDIRHKLAGLFNTNWIMRLQIFAKSHWKLDEIRELS